MNILNVPDTIGPLIKSQFPAFYQEEGEGFIAFLTAYYEWLDEKYPRGLMALRDIDLTTDEFITHFKNTYLHNIQFDVATNKRLLVKNALDLYRAKGTERAVDLFMKLVYARAAKVYYPGDDILRLSAGDYVRPQYIEISSSKNNVNLVGKQITGTTSNATAFVERYIKRKTAVDYVHILYVTNIDGAFVPGEVVHYGDVVQQGDPIIIGSVTAGDVTTGGSGFAVGDIVEFVSDRGKGGKARITAIGEISGIVEFELIDGGFGFSLDAVTAVSDSVITISNVATTNVSSEYFPLFTQATQPIVQLTYENATGNVSVGGDVTLKSNNTTTVSTGIIVRSDVDADETGIIWVYTSANSSQMSSITQIHDDMTANVTLAEPKIASGNVIGASANLQITVADNTEALQEDTILYQYYANGLFIGSANVVKTYTTSVADIELIDGNFIVANPYKLTVGGANSGNVTNIQGKIGVYQTNNVFYANGAGITINTTTGIVTKKSTGQGADFNIGSITNQEVLFRNFDYLYMDTAPRVNSIAQPMPVIPMMDLMLNEYAYGFFKEPQGNLATTIYDCLTFDSITIGTIATLSGVNPGEQYDETPFVLVQEPLIAGSGKRDFIVTVTGATGNFTAGEYVHQTTDPTDHWTITVADGSTFQVGHLVEQGIPATAFGVVQAKNGNVLTVTGATGSSFTNGQTLYNPDSSSVISSAVLQTDVVTGFGKIRQIDGDNIYIQRLSFDAQFYEGENLVGESSGVTATIDTVQPDFEHMQIGANANLTANVITSDDSAEALDIVDSGIGYTKDEDVTFFKVGDPSVTGTFRVHHTGSGFSQGYFRSTSGFLSTNKYIFDGEYYQEYSYEVISSVPFDKYRDVMNKVMHVAGTRMFGSVLLESTTNGPIEHVETTIAQVDF